MATKTTNDVVTDNDMALPPKWKEDLHADPESGHTEDGRTICVHSLGVLPEYQGCGLGTTLIKAYQNRIEESRIADKLALIAHEHLIDFYTKLGFENKGRSKAQFGGGGWYDMVCTRSWMKNR